MVMSNFIVHAVPGSPFARTVLATLEKKGARYHIAPVIPGTLKSPEYLASAIERTAGRHTRLRA